MNRFTLSNWKGDLFGGITAGIVALPLALGFGIASGLGAASGLYGAIFLGFWAALLGGTPSQISGPTGPMTVVASVVVMSAIKQTGSLANALGVIVMTFVLSGILQVILGVLRLGQYIRYIPHPVVSGFMSGIGLIVIIMQLKPMLGVDVNLSWTKFFVHTPPISIWAILITIITIAIIYTLPLLSKHIPSTLFALVLVSLGTYFLKIPVETIGEIPMGFPASAFEKSREAGFFPLITEIPWNLIISSAFTLAALGAIDSLLTSVVADSLTKTRHKSNQELIGQGIGNIFAGFFGGIPGAGATMRTVVNLRSGGKTAISGIVHALVLLLILLGLGSLASEIPMAVLAGILITVGIGIIDYEGLRHIRSIPIQDTLVMLVVFILTVTVDLLLAVSVGMVMASIFFMKKMGDNVRKRSKILLLADYLRNSKNLQEFGELPQDILQNTKIFEVDGPFFFGAVYDILAIMRTSNNLKTLVLALHKVTHYDETGLLALRDGVIELQERNIKVLVIGVKPQEMKLFISHHIYGEIVPKENFFPNFEEYFKKLASQENAHLTTEDN